MDTNNEKKYSEPDVVSIIQQAIRDDQKSDDNLSQSDGLMLSEIEKIGEEVGIEPEQVRKAAAKLEMQKKLEPYRPEESGDEAIAQRLVPGSFTQEDIENLMMALKGKASRPKEPLNVVDDYDEIKRAGSTYEYVFKGIRTTASLTEDGCRINIYYPHQFEGTYTEAGYLSGGITVLLSIVATAGLKQSFEMDIGILHAGIMTLLATPFFFGIIRFVQKRKRHQTELKAEKLADEAEKLLAASSKKSAIPIENAAQQKESEAEAVPERRKER